jgi:hypothetical protein
MAFDLVVDKTPTEPKETVTENPRPKLPSGVRKEKPAPVIVEEKTPFRRIDTYAVGLEASLKSVLPRATATEFGQVQEALRFLERIRNIVSVMKEGRGSGAL